MNHRKRAVSSCVTSTSLKLLVTALDGRCDVSCCRALCCFFDLVLLRSNSGAPLIAFQCFSSCVLPRVPLEDDASLRSTTPSEPDLSTCKDYALLMIHSISTSGLHASLG